MTLPATTTSSTPSRTAEYKIGGAGMTLLGEPLADRELPASSFAARVAHDLQRQLPLEGGFDGGDNRRRVFAAHGVLCSCGERARADEVGSDEPSAGNRQRERRPRCRELIWKDRLPRTVLDEGAGSSAGGLREADEAVAGVHLLNPQRRDCRDCVAFQADLEAREPDAPAADVALVTILPSATSIQPFRSFRLAEHVA
jgi:hypothetical protein